MYTIKITNLVTGYELPTETTEQTLTDIKGAISFAAKYLRLNVVEWDTDGKGGLYVILESDDKESRYKYEIISNN